jgi:hypothetical protein
VLDELHLAVEAFGDAVAVWEDEHPQDFLLPSLEGFPEGLEQIEAAGFELFDELHEEANDSLFLQSPAVFVARHEHKSAYFWDGVHINGAEGYFSRLRCAEWGQHHHIGGKYLHFYAVECAWREDFRRVSNGEQFRLIAGAALQRPPSSRWAGYWQRL